MTLLPVDEALGRIISRIPNPLAESVPLARADGRVLAAAVVAGHDQPPFAASAMDGYAVRALDIVPGRPVRVVGTAQAGARYAHAIGPGECVRIFTGAPLPTGADAVIMQEDAVVSGEDVRFDAAPAPGRSVRPTGHDFSSGETLLSAGITLTPYALVLAAAANFSVVSVGRRPRVAVLATGDELVPPGTPLGADQIVSSNSVGLISLLTPFADSVQDLGIVSDDRVATQTAIAAALADGVDVLVTSGGASVGDRDVVQDVLKALGVDLAFWRIAMRPGKPLMFGTTGRSLVFGLPGNPVSALVTASVFILPALRAWAGSALPLGRRLVLPLAAPLPPNTARRHFVRAQIAVDASGSRLLPMRETDSGHTTSLARAEALIIQPEHHPGAAAGTLMNAIPLGGV